MKSAGFPLPFTSFSRCPVLTAPQIFKEGELMPPPPTPQPTQGRPNALMGAHDLQGGKGHSEGARGALSHRSQALKEGE